MLSSELYNYFKESSSVSTDTRLINKGSIFFALKGENFDGNKFAEEAIKSGASYAVIDDQSLNNPKFIKVKNVLKSLQDLSKFHRSKLLKTKIIALTGSNGKTTTKELISEVLKKKYKIISTIGNLNNHIGVPLTLLRIKQNTEIAIVEMGANHLNEIKLLTDLINPDFGLITNFGKAHLEGFGSIEGVIKGKSELYDFLIKNDKKAFINNDDYIQNQFIGNKISFSKEDKSNYIFKEVKDTNYAGLNYNDFIVDSKLTGNYNYHNIAFATSIGLYFNISIEKIKEAISNYIPSNNRSQIIKKNNKLIILDAYNANPTSMISAINSLIKKQGNKSVILGDMFELGNQSEKEHHDLIDFCVKNNFENIFLIGNEFFKQKDKFEIPFFYKTKDELNKHIKKFPITSKYILIKGSRVMRMENLINFI
ncbi:MAG: UDP-N-acetylmuramoyl-tripeptide--D-alanyl-D-alanine ligase [Flavobacteriales bacterium]|nr:MAG: UDP-N-acetylmuramoyl-tripeptide--D-alanyl-D-alanine ligase [Flavobacteriales bacterium]